MGFAFMVASHWAAAQEIPKFQIGPYVSLVKPFGNHQIVKSNGGENNFVGHQNSSGIELGVDMFYAIDSNYRIAGGLGEQQEIYQTFTFHDGNSFPLEINILVPDLYFYSIGLQRSVWTQGLYTLLLDLRYRSAFSSLDGDGRGIRRVSFGEANFWAYDKEHEGRPNGIILSLHSAVLLQNAQELGFTISYFNTLRSEPFFEGEFNYYEPGTLERNVIDIDAPITDFQGTVDELRSRGEPDVRSTFSSKLNQFHFRFFYLF